MGVCAQARGVNLFPAYHSAVIAPLCCQFSVTVRLDERSGLDAVKIVRQNAAAERYLDPGIPVDVRGPVERL